jgi:hypothetical protein
VAIIHNGVIKELSSYEQLFNDDKSMLHSYRMRQSVVLGDRITCLNILKEFQRKLLRLVRTSALAEEKHEDEFRQKKMELEHIFMAVARYSLRLKKRAQDKEKLKKKEEKKSFMFYARHAFRYIPLQDWLLGCTYANIKGAAFLSSSCSKYLSSTSSVHRTNRAASPS